MNSGFPTNDDLTRIVMAYKNRRMIADRALPRFDVTKMDDRYTVYDLSQGFTGPETAVGRRGRPNKVSFTASEKRGSCTDHALDDDVPKVDSLHAPGGHKKLVNRASERIANLIELRREIRTASLVFNGASYGLDNVETDAGEHGRYRLFVLSEARFGGTLAAGDPVTTDANGKAVKAAPGAGAQAFALGFAMVNAESGDIAPITLAPFILTGV